MIRLLPKTVKEMKQQDEEDRDGVVHPSHKNETRDMVIALCVSLLLIAIAIAAAVYHHAFYG